MEEKKVIVTLWLEFLFTKSNNFFLFFRYLPTQIGDLVQLRELMLNNNLLRNLPFELGRCFQLQSLGLSGNPLLQAQYIY